MSREDISRFKRRAEERKLAETVPDPATAKTCRELAEKYEAVAQAYEKLGS